MTTSTITDPQADIKRGLELRGDTIDTLTELSPRAYNLLRMKGLTALQQVLFLTEEELQKLPMMDARTAAEIRRVGAAWLEQEQEALAALGTVPEPEAAEAEHERTEEEWENLRQYVAASNTELTALPFSNRVMNCLRRAQIDTLGKLLELTDEQLLALPNMGRTSIEAIHAQLNEFYEKNKNHILAFVQKPTDYQPPEQEKNGAEQVEPDCTTQQVGNAAVLAELMQHFRKCELVTEYLASHDVPLSAANLPNRAVGRLTAAGYQSMSQILFLTEEQLLALPSMGIGTVRAIREQVENYLEKHTAAIVAYVNGDYSLLWSDERIADAILELYRDHPFAGLSFPELVERLALPEQIPQERLTKQIGQLLAQKKLEYVDFRLYRVHRSFVDVLSECDKISEENREVTLQRLSGKTLEEIGQTYDLTRERIRQKLEKTVRVVAHYHAASGDPFFDEDYFRHLFVHYSIEKEDAEQWFGITPQTYRYLKIVEGKEKKQDLSKAMNDQQLSLSLRFKIKNYLNRNKIYVDGVWMEKQRAELENVVGRKNFSDKAFSTDEFATVYNQFLTERNIDDRKLMLQPGQYRSRQNAFAMSRFFLCRRGDNFRYYDIDSRDYSELLDTLNLESFENVEISTLKFMDAYPDLMEKYGVQDQYELHNLLKKIVSKGSLHDIQFGHSPMIRFGTSDRPSLFLDLLLTYAPLTKPELIDLARKELGFETGPIPWDDLDCYYDQNLYKLDQKVMPMERLEQFEAALSENFYYLDEVQRIYAELFLNGDPDEVNSYNLKSIGFSVYSRYVMKGYPYLEAFFRSVMTEHDMTDLAPLRRRYGYVGMFSQILTELRKDLEIIEIEPGHTIHIRRLEASGITKDDLRDFCDAVYDFVDHRQYFSALSLRKAGFTSPLYDLGFDDWFYANLLYGDSRFACSNIFTSMIFHAGKQEFTLQGFLADQVREAGEIDTFDLISMLEDEHGCSVKERSKVLYPLAGTGIYHDAFLDRLYASEDAYYNSLTETEV